MVLKDIQKIGNSVKEMSGIDIFKNTRNRTHVELRALVCFILREKLGMRWTNISLYFESEGKTMHHATAIHSVKMYPIYRKYNNDLQELERCFNFKSELQYDEIDKLHYLQGKFDNLESKYNALKNKIKNNPILKVLQEIPEDYVGEVIQTIDLVKKSWEWKKKEI
jgi:hypothetical protein|tara:strand:- start:470 stop:967 length:498 start_codon:yes stop_codon:yes gene_type:complete